MPSYKSGFPDSIGTKIYKTGQTRGANIDEIYQNRVLRNNTVLIPTNLWKEGIGKERDFEKGYIVLARPEQYFSDSPPSPRAGIEDDLELGENLLVFYRTREEWRKYNPRDYGWDFATSRQGDLEGEYVARVPDTTSDSDSRIFEGFRGSDTGGVGAGIRVYEYASQETLERTRYQLAYLAWRTVGMADFVKELGVSQPRKHKQYVDTYCATHDLDDHDILREKDLIRDGTTVCPLCLKPIEGPELASKVDQVEGRETPDLTITKANLFHIEELRPGEYNHREYNLGWGHQHCNIVARDHGIANTVNWLSDVLENRGYKVVEP